MAIRAMQTGKDYAMMVDDCLSMKANQLLMLRSFDTNREWKSICILPSAGVNFKD